MVNEKFGGRVVGCLCRVGCGWVMVGKVRGNGMGVC